MATQRIAAFCIAIAISFLSTGFAHASDAAPQTRTVRFNIRQIPGDLHSPRAFAAILQITEAVREGHEIGWKITSITFRQPTAPGECDRIWDASNVMTPSPDGFWWLNHADPNRPKLDEFRMLPLLKGTANPFEANRYGELIYELASAAGAPNPHGVLLDYVLRIAPEPDPEEEGDDDGGDIDDVGDVPIGMPEFDFNQDGFTNGLDIAPFVSLCVAGCSDPLMDQAGCFVATLLGQSCDGMDDDCNANGMPDGADLFSGFSHDCNGNGVPDECDADSADLNANGVPDECEPDCNGNGIPDEMDIQNQTSADINNNGIPDACELDCDENGMPDDYQIATGAGIDCDQDGILDKCQLDCNGNGVADACDVDPADPDGDGFVSADCNGNQYPDECDLTLPPPFGSLDCNDNGIPDLCEIAGGACADENGNGVPDTCEAVYEAQGGSCAPFTGTAQEEESLAELVEWSMQQVWGAETTESGQAQFTRYVDKCDELEVPVQVGP